jgi:ABC-type Fe3+ transport system substrate-binding protein
LSGNKQVAVSVAQGQLAFGLTDTDDAIVERDQAADVELVFPDQGEDGLGALFIPNTLALIQGAAHPEAARRLVDYLLGPAVETQLAQGASAQFPPRRASRSSGCPSISRRPPTSGKRPLRSYGTCSPTSRFTRLSRRHTNRSRPRT